MKVKWHKLPNGLSDIDMRKALDTISGIIRCEEETHVQKIFQLNTVLKICVR